MTHLLPSPRPARRVLAPRALMAFALMGALMAGPFPAGAADSSQLQQTRDRIAQTIAELEQVNGEAAQTEAQLAAAEAHVQQLEEDLNALLAALESQETRVVAARTVAEEASAEKVRIEQIVGDRARRAFMAGDSSPLMMLGSGGMDDFNAALDGLAILDALAARADASLETLDAARIAAAASAEVLQVEVDALEQVRAAHEEVLDEAQVVLGERALALQSLAVEQERLMAEQEDLEAEAAQIQQLIADRAAAARRAAEAAAEAAAKAAAKPAASTTETKADTSSSDAPPPPPPSSGCYAWPASGKVTSEYGPRWGRMHAGLDIDGDTGDRLYAAQAGTVIYVGYYSAYGNLTLISHSDGITTAYAHQSAFGVSEGQTVARGEYIGKMGATGRVTGSHLHFETRTSGGTKNPRNYLC